MPKSRRKASMLTERRMRNAEQPRQFGSVGETEKYDSKTADERKPGSGIEAVGILERDNNSKYKSKPPVMLLRVVLILAVCIHFQVLDVQEVLCGLGHTPE